jgi:hypothetical protein
MRFDVTIISTVNFILAFSKHPILEGGLIKFPLDLGQAGIFVHYLLMLLANHRQLIFTHRAIAI